MQTDICDEELVSASDDNILLHLLVGCTTHIKNIPYTLSKVLINS
jgi:hypothetical protein